MPTRLTRVDPWRHRLAPIGIHRSLLNIPEGNEGVVHIYSGILLSHKKE